MPAQPPIKDWSTLASFLDRPLEIIDVGCRWGPAQQWLELNRVNITGFDADALECEALNERFSENAAVRFVPLALGPSSGLKTLYVTQEPACSSFYPPDDSAIDAHPALSLAAPLKEIEVQIVSLDEWLAKEGGRPVDFIKLDTQGSELGVLQGATRALRSVQAVETEVQFNPIYKGVPLFGDVDRFLRESGFVLWRLADLAHYGLSGGVSGFERQEAHYFDSDSRQFAGKGGQIFWGNAFYVRAAGLVSDAEPDWGLSLRRACIGAGLEFYDLAQRALESAVTAAPPHISHSLREMSDSLQSL